MGKYILEGRNVTLTIHKVGEINISGGEVIATFRSDLVNSLKGNVATAGLASKAVQPQTLRYFAAQTSATLQKDLSFMDKLSDADKIDNNLTSIQVGQANEAKQVGRARPQSAGRGEKRNPITGELISRDDSSIRPGSVSSQGSSRPGSSSSSTNAGNVRPSSAGRGRPAAAPQPKGAREIAARALSNNAQNVVQKVREKIIERGGSNGIRSVTRLFSIMDENGDKRLSKEELKYGLRDYGIELSPVELEQVFLYFDKYGKGYIDLSEFLMGIRGELSGRRKKFIKMAFDTLDTDRSGSISVEEIMSVYDFDHYPEVRSGKKTVKEAAREFMAHWERKEHDGDITYEEFEDYYADVSASIDDDTYFELMIRNAWRISGGEGMAANTANRSAKKMKQSLSVISFIRRVLVTNKDGSQSVQTINRELGMNPKDLADIKARLGEQGLQGDYNVDLYGKADNREKAKNPNGRSVNDHFRALSTLDYDTILSHFRHMRRTQVACERISTAEEWTVRLSGRLRLLPIATATGTAVPNRPGSRRASRSHPLGASTASSRLCGDCCTTRLCISKPSGSLNSLLFTNDSVAPFLFPFLFLLQVLS